MFFLLVVHREGIQEHLLIVVRIRVMPFDFFMNRFKIFSDDPMLRSHDFGRTTVYQPAFLLEQWKENLFFPENMPL